MQFYNFIGRAHSAGTYIISYILSNSYFQNFHENPQAARQQINDWVAQVTKNNIQDLIPADGITGATKLVLANAAYFKGVWASKFPAERTKKQVFFVSETRQTLVPFMKQKGTFHYSEYKLTFIITVPT